jgi:protein arginine kinase activator
MAKPSNVIKCQQCAQPATVHLTNVDAAGRRTELHLCRACAEEKKVISQQELNLSSILQALIGAQGPAAGVAGGPGACPACGIQYTEFRAEGRLGCPHDYEAFRAALGPLLQRIHRSAQHVGKSPRHSRRSAAWQRELLDLRRRLREAIDEEAYERAATLRDLIRQKERPDSPGRAEKEAVE